FFFSVRVYVKLNHNSPRILCLTNQLRNLELIDPIFQWTGPGGGLSSENSSVKISPSGTLILRHFNQSGVYTCSIVYKLTAMQPVEHLIIKYLIYVYKIQVLCIHIYIKRNMQQQGKGNGGVKSKVEDLISYLNWVPYFGFFAASFSWFLFLCSFFPATLISAKHLIERFFKQQVENTRKSSEPLPKIYYIEGTLQMVRVDCCSPGYGMNAQMHPECPECCVVCSPGSYNPSNGNHCLQCDRSLIYGATKC
ncbi:ZPBP1 protein, partial [Eolophus roseicapillus]|nr:ZPBP1 protein [Eolophus roseicapilla]